MAELNQICKVKAGKIALGKTRAIAKLNVRGDMTLEERDALARKLAEAKVEKEGGDYADRLRGQAWYVNDLCDFAKLTTAERFQQEYRIAYDEHVLQESTEDDIVSMLDAIENQADDEPVAQVANS